jgi:WD40 repeat protein
MISSLVFPMTLIGTLTAFAIAASTMESRAQTNPPSQSVGIFDGHLDVGTVLHPGSVLYDKDSGSYTVAGSGENMWFGIDDFQFAWKKTTGDISISADINFLDTAGNAHKKAVVMMRQTLDGPSVAVDVAVHGSGLTSLQYRYPAGANTHEVEANVSGPRSVRLEKRGDFFYAFVSGADGKLHPAGTSIKVPFTGEFYVGIGVCAHDKDDVQKAVFRNVSIKQLAAPSGKQVLLSSLETVSIASTDRHVEYVDAAHFEAPNWSRDGKFLIFNQDGTLHQLALGSAMPELIPTAPQIHCNNDHGLSPDGEWLAISDQTSEDHKSRVYIVPAMGGTPRLVTPSAPSYWHGWSPDGKTLAFTGERNGNFDIYSIPAAGGEETRLTSAPGLDDGPEYLPDGTFIYFNSERTGHMQIWRMKADGSEQEHVIESESNDWFPHISPDGEWMVYVAYEPGVSGHPANKDVELRLRSLKDKSTRVLAKLFGGQGTINVPSWSPDSKRLAFVSYQLLPEESLAGQ